MNAKKKELVGDYKNAGHEWRPAHQPVKVNTRLPRPGQEVLLRTIAATTSRTGLTVHADLDGDEYPTGIRISDEAIAALPITRHRFHGERTTPRRPWHRPHPKMTVLVSSALKPRVRLQADADQNLSASG